MWLSEESPREIETSTLDFGQELKFLFSTTAAPQIFQRSSSEDESPPPAPKDISLSDLELIIH